MLDLWILEFGGERGQDGPKLGGEQILDLVCISLGGQERSEAFGDPEDSIAERPSDLEIMLSQVLERDKLPLELVEAGFQDLCLDLQFPLLQFWGAFEAIVILPMANDRLENGPDLESLSWASRLQLGAPNMLVNLRSADSQDRLEFRDRGQIGDAIPRRLGLLRVAL